MTPEDLVRLKKVFLSARELRPEERKRYLDSEPDLEPGLRSWVEGQLEKLELDLVSPLGPDPGHALDPEWIGPYRIQQRLGQGGMGVVYAAEQEEPIQRQVAVKRIRAGLGSEAVLARFRAEQEALSAMEHPAIARVLDAGTDAEGRPFIAMEFVSGPPLDVYCEREGLDLASRLRLFVDVCRGVQHAHDRGVLHRDLKPGNVLVTEVDGDPVPKIIDFGIAKALSAEPTGDSLHTRVGTLLGTPEYMAPEQASAGARHVDVRTDVYSLGVIVYELLCGMRPIDLAQAGEDLFEIMRVLGESQPSLPSRRCSSTHAARLRGDLDWITMRALAKNPGERYASARALAEDVQRYLTHQPVQAGPPTWSYRARRAVRRNRVSLTIIGALFLGTLVATYFAIEASQQARRAESARKAQETALGLAEERRQAQYSFFSDWLASAFLTGSFIANNHMADLGQELIEMEAPGFMEALDGHQGLKSRDSRMSQARVALEVGVLRDPLASMALADRLTYRLQWLLGVYTSAADALALQVADRSLELRVGEPEDLRVLITRAQWALLHLDAGNSDEVLVRVRTWIGELEGRTPDQGPRLALYRCCLAAALAADGRDAEAYALFERSIPVVQKELERSPLGVWATSHWISFLDASGRTERAAEVRRRWIRSFHRSQFSLRQRRHLYLALGPGFADLSAQFQECIQAARAIVGLEPAQVDVPGITGRLLELAERLSALELAADDPVRGVLSTLAGEVWDEVAAGPLPGFYSNRGLQRLTEVSLLIARPYSEVDPYALRWALNVRRDTVAFEDPDEGVALAREHLALQPWLQEPFKQGLALSNLGQALLMAERYQEAVPPLIEAERLIALDDAPDVLSLTRARLGSAFAGMGDLEQAAAAQERAEELVSEGSRKRWLTRWLLRLGRYADALTAIERTSLQDRDPVATVHWRVEAAAACFEQDTGLEALAVARGTRPSVDPEVQAGRRMDLARAALRLGEGALALELAGEAVELDREEVRLERAAMALQVGDLDSADRLLSEALEHGEGAAVHALTALLFSKLELFSEAVEAARRAREEDPALGEASLAQALLAAGEEEEALVHFQAAATGAGPGWVHQVWNEAGRPNGDGFWTDYGRVSRRAGRVEEAGARLERLTTEWPGEPWAWNARARFELGSSDARTRTEGRDHARLAVQLSKRLSPAILLTLAEAESVVGHSVRAREISDEIRQLLERGPCEWIQAEDLEAFLGRLR